MSKEPPLYKRESRLQKPKTFSRFRSSPQYIQTKQSGNSSTASSASSSYSENGSIEKNELSNSKSITKGFSLKAPKNKIDKIKQSSKILELRKQLNEINRKNDEKIQRVPKSTFSDITRNISRENSEERRKSGPYSLFYELQTQKVAVHLSLADSSSELYSTPSSTTLSSSVDEIMSTPLSTSQPCTPQILALGAKSLKEFEYCCNNKLDGEPSQSLINTQEEKNLARSELRLNFKNSTKAVPIKLPLNFLSPTTDSASSRAIDDFSLDDSLGILTPDQMDDFLEENPFSPTVEITSEDLMVPNSLAEKNNSPSSENTESPSPDSTVFSKNSNIDNSKEQQMIDLVNKHENKDRIPNASHCCLSDQYLDERNKNFELMVCPEEEQLTSLQSSILEPMSSAIDTTVNLDLPIDSRNFEQTNHSMKRTDATPSPEELPLDPTDMCVESVACSTCNNTSSVMTNSQIDSDCKTDPPKSMETSKVSSSFITSITSMTSLDGYQGDGEMSRPVSRGPDQSPLLGLREDIIDWQNVPVHRRPNDAMTDSDFFTESDADGHEDHHLRGDRKAQVIDGALYAKSGNPPLIVNNRNDDSCMESSGVYTDTEAHRMSPVFLNALDEGNNLPEGSSPSSQSICSQNNDTTLNKTMKVMSANEKEISENTITKSDENLIKTPRNSSERSFGSSPKSNKQDKRFTLKKYKMPKRDVPSKLKTMLTTKKDDSFKSENSSKSSKKSERRVTPNKKLLNESVDHKNRSYKDVKSKVGSFALQRSQTTCSVTIEKNPSDCMRQPTLKPKQYDRVMNLNSSLVVGSKSSVHSSQSDISASSTPIQKNARNNTNGTNKKRELAPVTSLRPAASPITATPTKLTPATVKKNGTLPKLTSSPVVRSRPVVVASPGPPTPTNGLSYNNNNNGTPSPKAKQAARRTATLPNRPASITVKDPIRMTNTSAAPQVKSPPKAAAVPAPQTQLAKPRTAVVQQPSSADLAHAAKGFEALGVLVQYLVFKLEALNAPALREEASRWRDTAATQRDIAAKAARNHAQRTQRDLETISECLNKISSLERELAAKEEENTQLLASNYSTNGKYNDALAEVTKLSEENKELKTAVTNLKREVSESSSKLVSQSEKKRAMRQELDCVKAELMAVTDGPDKDIDVADKGKEELIAEVRSLRAVLELKQAEAGALRIARAELQAEIEKRDHLEKELEVAKHATEELKERAAARQAEAERLREQNQRLKEAAAHDAAVKTRLDMCNEELRYKLRQKSKVVNLLAVRGNSFHERTYSPPRRSRTSSCGSVTHSESPDASPSHSEGPDSPAVCRREPSVKAVVEKHDSVSWVVEIEETPEETASRLTKRSNSFKKRRTMSGPSPPGSPRAAQPSEMEFGAPLKESAGEAIYIYDNRQF